MPRHPNRGKNGRGRGQGSGYVGENGSWQGERRYSGPGGAWNAESWHAAATISAEQGLRQPNIHENSSNHGYDRHDASEDRSWHREASFANDPTWTPVDTSCNFRRCSLTTVFANSFNADHLTLGNADARFNLPWSLLNLGYVPDLSGEQVLLHWRLHLVGVHSQVNEFNAGPRNTWSLTAGHRPSIPLRTGIADVTLAISRRAPLQADVQWERNRSSPRILHLHVAPPWSVCIEHRQPDHGLCCLCPEAVDATEAISNCSFHQISSATSRSEPLQAETVSEYQQMWRGLVELEAAANAVEESCGRILFDVRIDWSEEPLPNTGDAQLYGSFLVPAALMRVHRVKFRSAIDEGEWASSWLCLRRKAQGHGIDWTGHGAVVSAFYVEEEQEMEVMFGEDEEMYVELRPVQPTSLRVKFRLVIDSSDGAPESGSYIIETIPKSLASSCMASSLATLRFAPLTQELVLVGRSTSTLRRYEADADLSAWLLNPSQLLTVQHALSEPLTVVQGPPGTGKTRTTAVLATLFAKRNIGAGENRAVLFCAPTNRAVDCAVLFVAQLCSEYANNLLHERRADDSTVCAICLQASPDTITVCNHVFHADCLRTALKSSRLCPICRRHVKHIDSGLRILRIYGADAEQQEFPVPRKYDHPNVETRKPCPVPESLRRFSLHWRCHAAVQGETHSAEAVAVRAAYREMVDHGSKGPRAEALRMKYQSALCEARAAEIRDADIIFTTNVSCRRMAVAEALSRPDAPSFRQVIIDEAGQATEPETLCPLAFAVHSQQICLFGDHKQLRPILKSRHAEFSGLHISLFERLAIAGESSPAGEPCFLEQQYRMHPQISVFPSKHFYGGRLFDDASIQGRTSGLLEMPARSENSSVEATALVFWDFALSAGISQGLSTDEAQPVRTSDGGVGSRKHAVEAQQAVAIAHRLVAAAGSSSVGILAWYNAQVAAMSELLGPSCGVHVGSIATAQGSEWDYVLLSTVRRGKGSLGIVADPHMFNVALTRARLGLIVLGDSTTLGHDKNWNAFISHCRCAGKVVAMAPSVTSDKEILAAAVKRALKSGLRVVLHGLQSSPELNGSEGEVISSQEGANGRWEVQLMSGSDSRRLSLKPSNLRLISAQPPRPQAEVPKTRKFNGLSALVSADRRGDAVEFSKKLSLKPDNLEILADPPLKRGAKVRLHSLKLAAMYNGLMGKVRSQGPQPDGRWEVEIFRMFDMRQAQVEARPGKKGLEVTSGSTGVDDARLGQGVNVVLQGLADQAEYNAEWGTITSVSPNTEGLWEVEILKGGALQKLLFKSENLAPEVVQ